MADKGLPALNADVATLITKMAAVEARVAALENRPTGTAPDTGALETRITAIEARLVAQPGQTAAQGVYNALSGMTTGERKDIWRRLRDGL